VVDNLVSNAVKYNVDGGSIAVRTSSDGTSTFIDVQDTGVGISAEDQRRLFEQYFRARRDVEGSGLGLSISRDIVRAHGGDITVRSAPGTGSTFTVRLPAQPRGPGDRELHA
jgi:signal transduction histidine kinase